MIILRSKQFVKEVEKLPLKVRDIFKEKIEMFYNDPYNQIFKNHKLKGSWKHYRSINITGDYRAIYEEHSRDILIFIRIGTHSELYGN